MENKLRKRGGARLIVATAVDLRLMRKLSPVCNTEFSKIGQ